MPVNPKKAWVSIRRLMGGETIHHTTTKLIQMRLPSGSLAENDEENVSVFASHFFEVVCKYANIFFVILCEAP